MRLKPRAKKKSAPLMEIDRKATVYTENLVEIVLWLRDCSIEAVVLVSLHRFGVGHALRDKVAPLNGDPFRCAEPIDQIRDKK